MLISPNFAFSFRFNYPLTGFVMADENLVPVNDTFRNSDAQYSTRYRIPEFIRASGEKKKKRNDG